jgi:steroid 5-alpha reductase family enzyme
VCAVSARFYAGGMDPSRLVLTVAGAASALAWLLSLLTREHSWVDRLWSILPVVYLWIFAASAGLADPRLNLMAALVTLWGARLTANFARKGGYTGTEDYRWAILRERMPRWAFEAVNLFFIVLFQNTVLLLIAMPALTAAQHTGTRLGILDLAAAAAFLLLLLGETVADEQQWRFQVAKSARHGAAPHFVDTGLWRYSRHPNFFFEQSQWWVLFLFGAIAAGSVLQWTLLGAALLSLLFVGSTAFTESITLARYPEYAAYRATTSPIVPWPPRRRDVAQPSAAGGG